MYGLSLQHGYVARIRIKIKKNSYKTIIKSHSEDNLFKQT